MSLEIVIIWLLASIMAMMYIGFSPSSIDPWEA